MMNRSATDPLTAEAAAVMAEAMRLTGLTEREIARRALSNTRWWERFLRAQGRYRRDIERLRAWIKAQEEVTP